MGGAGTGESAANLAAAVHGVKSTVGPQVPVLVQGMDSLQEVFTISRLLLVIVVLTAISNLLCFSTLPKASFYTYIFYKKC